MTLIHSLNGPWQASSADDEIKLYVNVPGSVYASMTEQKMLPDPYYRLNQYSAEKISEKDFIFRYDFIPDEKMLASDKICLRFDGIDTVSEVFLNDEKIGRTDNMHREYEFDVTGTIKRGSNAVRVYIHSPLKYISDKNACRPLWGVSSTSAGYPHIRKAHYMFGWDWGPVLPDMGIWRDVSVVGVKYGRIRSIHVRQEHRTRSVRLVFDAELADISSEDLSMNIKIISPDGSAVTVSGAARNETLTMDCVIPNPALWNVRGFGKQNLYTVKAKLSHSGSVIDTREFRIGLRKIELCRQPDNYGEEFCFRVNGVKIFAMGANYIPEDNIIARQSKERTEALLKSCASANYNMIRVWGGGFYPDDYFYETCDRLGLLVWQDFMFACSVYDTSDKNFLDTVKQEIICNVKRIRNHPCIALWCGNNEIESAWQYWGLPDDPVLKSGYLEMFERLIPEALKECDPDAVYWPSSPSSGGGFDDSGAKNKGDIHYWEVWHSLKPFTEYGKYLFRFCSEYGFESIPCMKTVSAFAEKNDLNLMSPVMEAHQKCEAGNEKLMYYLAQMVQYPDSFESLIYATQLVQADAIRLNVEHMRRNRGICMGSLYWQVNDSNPVISWSSLDYFGRWKALHYYARKFYAPVLCSVEGGNKERLIINVSNEKQSEFRGTIKWRARKNNAEILAEGEKDITVPPLKALNCLTVTKEMTGIDESMYGSCYLEYTLLHNNAIISDSAFLYCLPKQFEFLPPEIKVEVDKIGNVYRFRFSSENFAKGVYLDYGNIDCIFSDNWFDLHGQYMYVIVPCSEFPPYMTVNDVKEQLKIKTYHDIAYSET